MKNRRIITKLSLLIVCILVLTTIIINNITTPISAIEYIKNTALQRKEIAESKYNEFKKNENQSTEVLISLSNIELNNLKDILPIDCEIVSIFHFYRYGDMIVSGSYIDCKGKSMTQIQSAYYYEIYNLVDGNLNHLKHELNSYYDQYMLDYSIAEADFNFDIVKENHEKEISIEELTRKIEFYSEQLESIKSGEFSIYGIRIIAKNSDILNIINNKHVSIIEKLEFDNNNIITPIFEWAFN